MINLFWKVYLLNVLKALSSSKTRYLLVNGNLYKYQHLFLFHLERFNGKLNVLPKTFGNFSEVNAKVFKTPRKLIILQFFFLEISVVIVLLTQEILFVVEYKKTSMYYCVISNKSPAVENRIVSIKIILLWLLDNDRYCCFFSHFFPIYLIPPCRPVRVLKATSRRQLFIIPPRFD